MKIGVLALQGDFAEHIAMLTRLGVDAEEVRLPSQLDRLDGLIIPGGESTTIGKLAEDFGLMEPLRAFGKSHAIWGTCAGAIFSRRMSAGTSLCWASWTSPLNAMPSGGRSIRSRRTSISSRSRKRPTQTRRIMRSSSARRSSSRSAERRSVLSTLPDERIVAAQQGHLLATSFHPELTNDMRFHEFFLSLAK